MMMTFGKKRRPSETAGVRYHSRKYGVGSKAAFVKKLKVRASKARRLNTVHEPRLARNQEIIIDRRASKYIVPNACLFTSSERTDSTQLEGEQDSVGID